MKLDPRRHRLTEDLLPEAEVKTIDPVLPSPELEELRKNIQSLRDDVKALANSLNLQISLLNQKLVTDLTELRGKFNWL